MTVWFLVLATAGALAEFGGVTLIALDIRDSRSQARRILHQEQRVYLGIATEFETALPIIQGGLRRPSSASTRWRAGLPPSTNG